jgi:hypothetical protein
MEAFRCPTRARTWTLLDQNQTCCQLHHRTFLTEECKDRNFIKYRKPVFLEPRTQPWARFIRFENVIIRRPFSLPPIKKAADGSLFYPYEGKYYLLMIKRMVLVLPLAITLKL